MARNAPKPLPTLHAAVRAAVDLWPRQMCQLPELSEAMATLQAVLLANSVKRIQLLTGKTKRPASIKHELIDAMLEQGTGIDEIAKASGTSEHTIRLRKKSLETNQPVEKAPRWGVIPTWERYTWFAEQDLMLGRDTDESVALLLDRPLAAIVGRRRKLGIPGFKSAAWSAAEIAQLGSEADNIVADRTGRSLIAVKSERAKRGIPAYRPDGAKPPGRPPKKAPDLAVKPPAKKGPKNKPNIYSHEEIQQLWRDGLTVPEIVKKIGCSKTAARRIIGPIRNKNRGK